MLSHPEPLLESEPNLAQSIFRQEALDHLLKEGEIQEPLKISPPWTWALFYALGGLLLTALVASIFGKVEIQNTGKGILRPAAGLRLIQAQIGGVLAESFAKNGDTLLENQPICRIESAQMQGAMLESERQLQLLHTQGKVHTEQEEKQLQEQIRAVQMRIAHQETQVRSFERSVSIHEKKLEATRQLLAEKLVAALSLDDAQDQLNGALRMLDSARQQLAQLRQEQASLIAQSQRNRWQRTQEVSSSQSKRDALDSSLRQTLVTTPVAGSLDALVSRPGDIIQPGQTIAKIIPSGSPLLVIAFLPEKDQAFVKVGDLVQLELEAYPFTEFGTLKGRVKRLGSDLASPHEVIEALGETAKLEGPCYRVEVELLPQRPKRLENVKIRPGMLLQTRFTLRRQALISVFLDPLKRWLE